MDHHAVQRALVRMLYDPGFVSAVHARPGSSGLDDETLAAVRAVDPRALRADPQRRLRTLGSLMEEFRIGSSLALAETRSRAFVEGFFSSPFFHRSVEERAPLALAFGAYLLAACEDGTLREVRTPDVLRLELMQARARREAGPIAAAPHSSSLRLAPGVVHGRVSSAVWDTIARVERHLFELALLPAAGFALVEDAPRLALPPPPAEETAISLLVVPATAGLALVTLDEELDAAMALLGDGAPHPRTDVLARLAARLGAARAEALIAELLDDEVLAPAG